MLKLKKCLVVSFIFITLGVGKNRNREDRAAVTCNLLKINNITAREETGDFSTICNIKIIKRIC